MYKVAVLGDYESIFGFSALGLDIFPVSDAEDAVLKFNRLTSDGFSVIYITEALAAKIDHVIQKHRENMLPAIILIPGVSGNTGNGVAQVKKMVEQAVGSDIIFGSN